MFPKNRSIPNSSLLQLKKYFGAFTHVLGHKKLINRIRNDIIPFLISTNPRWRPLCQASPLSENHLHAIIIMLLKLFSELWNLEYITITILLIECAYQHKIQHGCHIGKLF